MKLFSAALVTESSDLTPILTTENQWVITRYGDPSQQHVSFSRAILSKFREMARSRDWTIIESICATSVPGGRTKTDVYESLRKNILNDLKEAMPVDGVLLSLHGAMMAQGYDDCEGDLLSHIRALIGPNVPIGIELDPHCHISDLMMKSSTAIILFKTMLHTDYIDRAEELFHIIAGAVEGNLKPTMALFDCRMMNCTGFDETVNPMKSFLQKIVSAEEQHGVLSISPVHCFPLADIPQMGSKMLVITNNDSDLAEEVANKFGMEFSMIGQQLSPEPMNITLDRAVRHAAVSRKVFQLIELSDLSGCGFPTDGTDVLRTMLCRGMTDVAVGFIWDPIAVSICLELGQGSEVLLRIGGKTMHLSGMPLDMRVVIERVYRQASIVGIWDTPHCCDVAVVSAGSTQLLLTSSRIFGNGQADFRQFGVEPDDKQYVLSKTGGSLDNGAFIFGPAFDYRNWSFTNITRPKWPWDIDPFLDQPEQLDVH